MSTSSSHAVEICIRVDGSTLCADAAKAAARLAQMVRRRYRAAVISTTVMYPRASGSVVVSEGGVYHP